MAGTRLREQLSLGNMDASGDAEKVYHDATRSEPNFQAVLMNDCC